LQQSYKQKDLALRGSGRELGPKNKAISCVLYLKEVLFAPNDDLSLAYTEESWSCDLEKFENRYHANGMVNIEGIDKSVLDSTGAESGLSILTVIDASISEDGGTLLVPDDAHWSVDLGDIETSRRNRRLQAVTGAKSVRVVKVRDSSNNAMVATLDQLSDEVFGTGTDVDNLKSQYDRCSFGQLIFNKEAVVETTLSINCATSGDAACRDAATANQARGSTDYVMYCLPDNTPNGDGSTGWVAYAYINSWRSIYRGGKFPKV
jgi:hypothetical protein